MEKSGTPTDSFNNMVDSIVANGETVKARMRYEEGEMKTQSMDVATAEQREEAINCRFKNLFRLIQSEVFATAVEKGWWEENRNEGELIALMHSELSEALEALRHGNGPSDKIPEFSGVEEEFADTIIRIMDYAQARGMDVAGALIAKAKFNKSRPHKHGGKKF